MVADVGEWGAFPLNSLSVPAFAQAVIVNQLSDEAKGSARVYHALQSGVAQSPIDVHCS